MQLARLLGGNYPYRTYIPVYDASDLSDGELLMRASTFTGATGYYITAYTSDNVEAEDSIGITLSSSEAAYASKENAKLYNLASAVPSRDASTGFNFMEAIVNPDATYFAFHDQTTAKSVTTASTSTTFTVASLEDNIDGGWIYTTDGTDSAATYAGSLRYISAAAAGSCTTTALTVDTSSDFIKVLPIGHRLTGLNAEATGMTTAIAAETGVYLTIRENWITHAASAGRELMRKWNHDSLDGLSNVLIEAEIAQLRHCYRAVVA